MSGFSHFSPTNYIFISVEYRIDLFVVFMLLGLVQALFLSIFYLGSTARKMAANRYQGIFLLAVGGVVLEILLMYTGYILDLIHLVDFSEPLALLLGPMIYFIVYSFIHDKAPKPAWPHYALPLAYALYNVLLLIQPVEVKYNAYLDAYHPDWPRKEENPIYTDDPLNIRSYHSLLTALSILFYTMFSFRSYLLYCRRQKLGFWKVTDVQIRRGRNYLFISMVMVTLIFLFKTIYDRDLGDHFIGASITLLIYFSSFELIRSAQLLKLAPASGRYSKSSLTGEKKAELIERIKEHFSNGQAHLAIGFTLPNLSRELGVSSHHLSEAINEGFGKSFFELLAEYRVKAACQLLHTEEGKRIKMEEVAERVGYSSKSSFNTQFKKITGKTPSQYRDGV